MVCGTEWREIKLERNFARSLFQAASVWEPSKVSEQQNPDFRFVLDEGSSGTPLVRGG